MSSTKPTYKLYYFAVKGKGEFIRLVFEAAGKEYEDVRYTFDDFPKHKQEMPFGQMPVLEIDGKHKLAQTFTIVRYLALEFGLAGKNKLEHALADQYCGVVEDISAPCGTIYVEKDEARKAEGIKKFKDETSVTFFPKIEKILAKSSSGFLIGDSLTYADLAFLHLYDFMEAALPDDAAEILAKYPKCKQHREKIKALPRIAAWLEKRPKTAI